MDNKLGPRIRQFRMMLDWSQRYLSKRSGVDQSKLSRVENGEASTSLTIEELSQIAEAFGLTAMEMLDFDAQAEVIQKIILIK